MATGDDAGARELSYFGIQSRWGVTKHLGGRRSTERLVELCGITPDSALLEVGCGVGITACHLARAVGCPVTSVDLSETMIGWAQRRAQREGLADRITFLVADAQELPFPEGSFDVVISESVTAFAPDKARAVGEYLRVLRPGGRVGLTEASWVKAPPPADLVAFLGHAMDGAAFHEPAGWRALLERAGFADVHAEVHRLTAVGQFASDLSGQGWRDIADRFRAMGDFIRRYLTDADLRRYARTLMPSAGTMRNMFTYFGYGLYTGRKASWNGREAERPVGSEPPVEDADGGALRRGREDER